MWEMWAERNTTLGNFVPRWRFGPFKFGRRFLGLGGWELNAVYREGETETGVQLTIADHVLRKGDLCE